MTSFALMLFCLADVWHSGLRDGVWLLGLIAAGLFLWTLGVFTYGFWFSVEPEPAVPSDWDRRDRPIPPTTRTWDDEDDEGMAA